MLGAPDRGCASFGQAGAPSAREDFTREEGAWEDCAREGSATEGTSLDCAGQHPADEVTLEGQEHR
jgi:hypothetical protein